jgi:photosystem II stability/assembly factor-like uncharacterized protein
MKILLHFLIAMLFVGSTAHAQLLDSAVLDELKFRNIGPAFTSGRIADIAIDSKNQNIMYAAAGSGGVWKTTNAGVTWAPIFDDQKSYSIGCVTIDPNNHNRIWVGTGENIGGRHVGFGDGIYLSLDAGKTWKNMGLIHSEHISKIIVHPTNSKIIWVAAQGPLWSSGGERGLYQSKDGGKTWSKKLGGNEWTGVTDIVMDPNNPDLLYAATWQRHRTVAALLDGGPGSGLHRSFDGGATWEKLGAGLPTSNIGKSGLAISPFNTNTIYAAIETDRKKGGLYISHDQGSSWSKQSSMVSGGTGPHYYQELYADPHKEGRIYLVSYRTFVSNDHGKTYGFMNEKDKHVDTHAFAWRMSDPDYLIAGTDGGIYESFDQAQTWRFMPNLPLSQYYKLAVDDAAPFYNIYGGTQDNGSHGGPSRTMFTTGIRSADWKNVLGADGHQSAIEPGNPDITYGEYQQGVSFRIDHKNGETVFVQPQPHAGEPHERFNWDAPILVSSFDPKRIYVASYRVWKSDNRGDAWEPISSDLTRNEERMSLPIMGKQQSWDNAWDIGAMSSYNTITSLAESPLQEGVLYAGTDDGIIQVTTDGGTRWTRIALGTIKGVPATAFVNDIRADLFDAQTVYAALDNHKYGDFKPYLIVSHDLGRSWKLISQGLPERLLVWRIVQDHIKKELLFAATEFGIYFTIDAGMHWNALKGGLPTIAFRDIAIQRRENDLVGASFGRGFFVLDDYSPLRTLTKNNLEKEAHLFQPKKAWWYVQKRGIYGQGASDYKAPNPEYGATFTYFLKEAFQSDKELRTSAEEKKLDANLDSPFPGWRALELENRAQGPQVILTVRDAAGTIVNTLPAKNNKGMNRVSWNLTYASKSPIKLNALASKTKGYTSGFMVTPATYNVTLSKVIKGVVTDLSEPVNFEVVPLMSPALKGASFELIDQFRSDYESFVADLTKQDLVLSQSLKLVGALQNAIKRADKRDAALIKNLYEVHQSLLDISLQMNGETVKSEVGEKSNPMPKDGLMVGYMALSTTYGPTQNHMDALSRAQNQLKELANTLMPISKQTLPDLIAQFKKLGGPWVEGISDIE